MHIKVNGKYRSLVKAALILVPVISIVTAAFTLPIKVTVPLAIALVIIPLILDRFIFIYESFLVMPLPTPDMERFMIGTCWYTDDPDTFEGLGIGLVYKYESAAKDAYQMLKSWNYGKLKDEDGNINISIIREGDGKFSVIFYPGERTKSLIFAKALAEKHHGKNSEVNMKILKYYIQTCVDYKNEPFKHAAIEAADRQQWLRINALYINGSELVPYAKKDFRIKSIKVLDRKTSTLGPIETMLPWGDPSENYTKDITAMTDRINQNLNEKIKAVLDKYTATSSTPLCQDRCRPSL